MIDFEEGAVPGVLLRASTGVKVRSVWREKLGLI